MTSIGRLTLPLFFVCACLAQTPAPPQFEVASIRPSNAVTQNSASIGVHIDGSQVRVSALSLKEFVGIAYRRKFSQVLGPDWVSNERFDISATLPSGAAACQIPEMLQALLADRFKLKVHTEKRDFSVYALVVGKPPLKLKEVKPDPADNDAEAPCSADASGGGSAAGINVNLGHGASWSFVPNHFDAKKLTMAQLAANIERFADRPIVDMTGLTGQYDFGFDINPEDYRPLLIRSAISAGVQLPPQAIRLIDNGSPSALADAVAQTGLKLDARKAPLDVIVVDDGLKTPTAN